MFDIRIANLDAGSYLRMIPGKAIVKEEKEKKNLYLQACLECRRTCTHMVYYADRIPGGEALDAQKRLAALLSYNLKWEYSVMCGFVRARISQAIVKYNILILSCSREKEASIQKFHDLTDGVGMALLAPWRG